MLSCFFVAFGRKKVWRDSGGSCNVTQKLSVPMFLWDPHMSHTGPTCVFVLRLYIVHRVVLTVEPPADQAATEGGLVADCDLSGRDRRPVPVKAGEENVTKDGVA